jgi:hypothetical protein
VQCLRCLHDARDTPGSVPVIGHVGVSGACDVCQITVKEYQRQLKDKEHEAEKEGKHIRALEARFASDERRQNFQLEKMRLKMEADKAMLEVRKSAKLEMTDAKVAAETRLKELTAELQLLKEERQTTRRDDEMDRDLRVRDAREKIDSKKSARKLRETKVAERSRERQAALAESRRQERLLDADIREERKAKRRREMAKLTARLRARARPSSMAPEDMGDDLDSHSGPGSSSSGSSTSSSSASTRLPRRQLDFFDDDDVVHDFRSHRLVRMQDVAIPPPPVHDPSPVVEPHLADQSIAQPHPAGAPGTPAMEADQRVVEERLPSPAADSPVRVWNSPTTRAPRPAAQPDTCCVCFAILDPEEVIEVCETCENGSCAECLAEWVRRGGRTCPTCRAILPGLRDRNIDG